MLRRVLLKDNALSPPDPHAAPDALLFATTPGEDGRPAAVLELLGTTVLGRLLSQLESLGVRRAWLVTRPEWEATVGGAAAPSAAEVTVVVSEGIDDDLRLAAEIAEQVPGSLLVGQAHVVAHREALARLLEGGGTAVLTTGSSGRAGWAFPIRCAPGRVVSAASPYHRVEGATAYSLGILRAGAGDRDGLIAASRKLAGLSAEPRPEEWDAELDRKAGEWSLEAADDVALRRRVSAGDAVSLLLVGLVRGEVDVRPRDVGRFFYAAPLSTRSAESAAAELSRRDEDRARLDSAVKADDSPFTTLLVSPYSKYVARFAARRGWSPNAVTLFSLALGLGAAAAFAAGTRPSLIAGALLLQISFTVDCVDGQLARYTRTFSSLGGWLDSMLDRMKEYLVYGGLALGAARGFDDDVWLLAACALAIQTVRHVSDFAWVAGRRPAVEPAPALPLDEPADHAPRTAGPRPSPWLHWGNQLLRLPIGERFALISLTAAIASPRATFVALLAWGGVGAAYALAVRILLTAAARPRSPGVALK
jgi:phosphatidylglycerophosphate synthase